MSLSVGIPNAADLKIGGKSVATIRALNEATAQAAAKALGVSKDDGKQVKTGAVGLASGADAQEVPDNTSTTVKMLLKRMQELQQQLREEQQQLAAARRRLIQHRKPRPLRSWVFRPNSRNQRGFDGGIRRPGQGNVQGLR